MHSRDDDLIRFSHGQRLYEAAPQPKRWLALSGGHNGTDLDAVQGAVKEWLLLLNTP